jgi:hypothetical protein
LLLVRLATVLIFLIWACCQNTYITHTIYGLNYHKNVTLEVIKEMVLALCGMNGWVSCLEAAKRYNIAFNDDVTTSPTKSERLQVCTATHFV